METVTTLLADLARAGVALEAEGDRLHYQPISAVTPALLERMKALKPDLLAHFRSKTANPPTDKTDGSPRLSVLSVGGGADSEFLSVINRWATPEPVVEPRPFGISQVVVYAPVDPLKDPGLLAHVTIVLNGVLRVFGIQARRAERWGFTLVYPDFIGPAKKPVPLLRPVDDETDRHIVECVRAALLAKSFLLDADVSVTGSLERRSERGA